MMKMSMDPEARPHRPPILNPKFLSPLQLHCVMSEKSHLPPLFYTNPGSASPEHAIVAKEPLQRSLTLNPCQQRNTRETLTVYC